MREYLNQQKGVQLRAHAAKALPALSPALQIEVVLHCHRHWLDKVSTMRVCVETLMTPKRVACLEVLVKHNKAAENALDCLLLHLAMLARWLRVDVYCKDLLLKGLEENCVLSNSHFHHLTLTPPSPSQPIMSDLLPQGPRGDLPRAPCNGDDAARLLAG